MAWHVAALGRVGRDFPSLEAMMGEPEPDREPMSADEIERTMQMWEAATVAAPNPED